jgi:hypothetical protein
MTESEATMILKNEMPGCGEKIIFAEGEKCEAYEMAIQSLEKHIPKKPIFDYNLSDTLSEFHCDCGNNIKVKHDIGVMDNNDAPNYCSKCGCKLDWSDKESEETKL